MQIQTFGKCAKNDPSLMFLSQWHILQYLQWNIKNVHYVWIMNTNNLQQRVRERAHYFSWGVSDPTSQKKSTNMITSFCFSTYSPSSGEKFSGPSFCLLTATIINTYTVIKTWPLSFKCQQVSIATPNVLFVLTTSYDMFLLIDAK